MTNWKDIVVPGLSLLGSAWGAKTGNPLMTSLGSLGAGYLGEAQRQREVKEKADLAERQRRFQRMSDFATQAQQDPSNPMLQGFANYYSKLAAGGLPSSQQLSDLESIYSNTAPELEKSQFVAAGRKAQAGEDIKSDVALQGRAHDIMDTWPARGPSVPAPGGVGPPSPGEPPVMGQAAVDRARQQLATEHLGERPIEMPLPGQPGRSVYVSPAHALTSATMAAKSEGFSSGGSRWIRQPDGSFKAAVSGEGQVIENPQSFSTYHYVNPAGDVVETQTARKGSTAADTQQARAAAEKTVTSAGMPTLPGPAAQPPRPAAAGGGGGRVLGKKGVPFTGQEKNTYATVLASQTNLQNVIKILQAAGISDANPGNWADSNLRGILMKHGGDPDAFYSQIQQALGMTQMMELKSMVGGNRPAMGLYEKVQGYTPDMARQKPGFALRMAQDMLPLLQIRLDAINQTPSYKGEGKSAMPPAPQAPAGSKVDFIYDEKGNLSPAP